MLAIPSPLLSHTPSSSTHRPFLKAHRGSCLFDFVLFLAGFSTGELLRNKMIYWYFSLPLYYVTHGCFCDVFVKWANECKIQRRWYMRTYDSPTWGFLSAMVKSHSLLEKKEWETAHSLFKLSLMKSVSGSTKCAVSSLSKEYVDLSWLLVEYTRSSCCWEWQTVPHSEAQWYIPFRT